MPCHFEIRRDLGFDVLLRLDDVAVAHERVGVTTVDVAARIGGRRVWLLLDSGNGDPLLVARHVARLAGIEEDGGEALVELDGLGPVRLQARPRDMIYDGILGAAFMQGWVITIDLTSTRAWAAPAGGSQQSR